MIYLRKAHECIRILDLDLGLNVLFSLYKLSPHTLAKTYDVEVAKLLLEEPLLVGLTEVLRLFSTTETVPVLKDKQFLQSIDGNQCDVSILFKHGWLLVCIYCVDTKLLQRGEILCHHQELVSRIVEVSALIQVERVWYLLLSEYETLHETCAFSIHFFPHSI